MTYFIYFLFGVWFLSGAGGLLAGALITFGPKEAHTLSPRPAWYHFASGVYTLTVASVFLWLYMNGSITEWWVLILSSIAFIPEVVFTIYWKRRK